MPSLAAAIVASLVAWAADEVVGVHLGTSLRVLFNLVVSGWAFYSARNFLRRLRGD